MRPSNLEEPNFVFVLNTLPECKVVLDFLEDQSATKPCSPNETPEEFADSTGVRFRRQTQRVNYYNTGGDPPGFTYEDSWQSDPEFRIQRNDVKFIKAAAERVLNQRNLTEKVFNKITKRTQAAKDIVAMLSEI